MPFSKVLESILEMRSVKKIPNKITKTTVRVDKIELVNPETPEAIKIVLIAIKKGNLPLQGTKLLVSMAISLSRGELIMRHPTTPAALQPNPMHMVVTIW